MRLLIKLLILRPKLVSRLHPGLERWILNTLKVNNLPRRMTRTSGTTKRLSFSRIFLLMHHQMGLNPLQNSLRMTKTVVFAKENPDNKAKTRILILLTSTLLPSKKTRTRIRTKKIYLTLNTTLISRKIIMPTNVLRRSQKTSVGFDNLHVSD